MPFLLLIAIACPRPVSADTVVLELIVDVPPSTPSEAVLGLVGNWQDWDHEDLSSRFARTDDGRYHLRVDVPRDRLLRFRLHRGSAASEEMGPDGRRRPLRTLRVGADRTLELTVAAWADDVAPSRTLRGDVREHSVEDVLDGRRLWVYLPPGYEESGRDHPLLVMLDGQNVFDASTSFAGEWEADETCERLVTEGRVEPLVIVAIDNGGAHRLREYTPWPDAARGGGGGRRHLERIVDELLPWVRARYRVIEEPSGVGLAGSSLGGLLTLHAVVAHPDVFGRLAALSPSILWARGRIVEELASRPPPPGARLWIDMGTREYGQPRDLDGDGIDDLVGALRRTVAALRSAGWSDAQLGVLEAEGALHHEKAWAQRLGRVLEFLFPADG